MAYSIDLPPSTATALTFARKRSASASNGCGPTPLPPYVVWSDSTAFSYVIRLVPAGAAEIPSRLFAPQDRVKPVLGTQDNASRVSLTCAMPEANLNTRRGERRLPTLHGAVCRRCWQGIHHRIGPGRLPRERSLIRAGSPSLRKIRAFIGRLFRAAAFRKGEGEPIHAIDNRPSTYWHSQWNSIRGEISPRTGD